MQTMPDNVVIAFQKAMFTTKEDAVVRIRNESILLGFLKEWDTWADTSRDRFTWAISGKGYEREEGLCASFTRYVRRNITQDRLECGNITRSLTNEFMTDNLSLVYPFGKNAYFKAHKEGTMAEDQVRREWVKQTIDRLERRLCQNS